MTKVYLQNKDNFVKRLISQEIILVPKKRISKDNKPQEIILLNKTSEFVWDFLQEKHSMEQIVDKILTNFENAETKVVLKDTKDLLKVFIEKGIIREIIKD
jgi:hypothetical protein